MKPNKKHLYQLLMRPPVNHGPQNEKNSVSRGREEEPSNLNLSEGPNRRLNANENAFEGKEKMKPRKDGKLKKRAKFKQPHHFPEGYCTIAHF